MASSDQSTAMSRSAWVLLWVLTVINGGAAVVSVRAAAERAAPVPVEQIAMAIVTALEDQMARKAALAAAKEGTNAR